MTRLACAAAIAGALLAWSDPGGFRPTGIALLALGLALLSLRLARATRRYRRRHTLDSLRRLSPAAFERAVGAWFARDGWLVEHHGKSGDHGIDLLAFHGDQLLAIQCKRYAGAALVSPAQVRELCGAAVAAGATRALLVTTGRIAPGALAWRETLRNPSTTLDFLHGDHLAALASGKQVLGPRS